MATDIQDIKPRGGNLYRKVVRFLERFGFREESFLVIMAVIVGLLTGLGSVGFSKLIELAHRVCYGHYGHSGLYGGRGLLLIMLPSGGALLVGVITYFFAREAKGHGVPEVMDAIARRDGRIRPRVAFAKAISSALTIGSGGSAGMEGPIIQIGAAIGSTTGQFFQISKNNMPVLVGCGAAGGISAIFHAPIAGVLFAMEIFLRDINFKSFSPVLIASVVSSVVVSMALGNNDAIFPLFNPDSIHGFQWFELGNYFVLGLICAVVAVAFIKLLYATEDFFSWLKVHDIVKPVIGAVWLGLLGLAVNHWMGNPDGGEPYIFANGYPMIGWCIGAMVDGASTIHLSVIALSALVMFKILATCCTLGSGGSGGVFAPSLFMGAVVGLAFGLTLQHLGFANISPATYSLVGMASVVAATTHAPMAAILIIFEMTRNYHVILPVMFAATIALTVAQLLSRDSIYTLKLRRRGVHYETRADMALLRSLTVKMVMTRNCVVIHDDLPLQNVMDKALGMDVADFIVVGHTGDYLGLLVSSDLRMALLQPESVPLLVAGELARTNVPEVGPEDTLDTVLNKFALLNVDSLPVHSDTDRKNYIGMITRAALMRRYQQLLHGQS